MTQPQDKMRAEFEAWYAQRFPNPRHENSTWDHAEKMDALEVWQAACAQQSAQSQQDALDAARYRWLRATGESQEEIEGRADVFNFYYGGELDAPIDAAIATQGASNV